jgi:hypothetical protein
MEAASTYSKAGRLQKKFKISVLERNLERRDAEG